MDFDHKREHLILGDSFGNVEIWDCSSIIAKIEKRRVINAEKAPKKKSPDAESFTFAKRKSADLFQTGVEVLTITDEDISIVSTRKRSHNDGITWINVIPKYNAYATSSYDCCAFIWSIDEFKRLGALFLGVKDLHWKFKVDEEDRQREDI